MIRVTFELLPGGREERKQTIGMCEIANIATHANGTADYAVTLKKTPPFEGALRQAWKKGLVKGDIALDFCRNGKNEDVIVRRVEGHHRTKRGVYDLVFRALRACGLDKRNPLPDQRAVSASECQAGEPTQ